MTQDILYRVVSAREWSDAQRTGRIRRCRNDRRAGRIHLNTRAAVETVAARYFTPEELPLAVALDTRHFAEDIEWLAPTDEHPWYYPMLDRPHLQLEWITALYPLEACRRQQGRRYVLGPEALVWAL
ncbi:hypothetical protein RE428_38040 [Marinobacter nanhaiticus D15-8W]|uniref:DUF952 domain-containing protein n=1 Tax=Marinobacter nanhaiticus D15-8W TaxID=626887 RepID=N6X5H6_9GAMM|nr:DUF952 domain-containing protein [Marinobacter nanhaiticus]ENO16353.1 DUF952 domain-containing protein [Marinobacter nanhaiticus D15-8W]BES72786.1 hypothetical protein RE428_38040 [Marinobacter nanhaiticus D15-8W]